MLKLILKNSLNKLGYSVRRIPKGGLEGLYFDFDKSFFDIFYQCKSYTMTSLYPERMYALYKAVEYLVKFKIPGDIVECGVWKGGSAMLCALALIKFGDTHRKIYLYDTYEGMNPASSKDFTYENQNAEDVLNEGNTRKNLIVPLDIVKSNLALTGYNQENLIFVKGKVEETIPRIIPQQISLLRLDTDWYQSTYHELCHLFPKISQKGIVLIDDYGYWQGAREAVDQYFSENKIPILLNRIDSTSRIGIKF